MNAFDPVPVADEEHAALDRELQQQEEALRSKQLDLQFREFRLKRQLQDLVLLEKSHQEQKKLVTLLAKQREVSRSRASCRGRGLDGYSSHSKSDRDARELADALLLQSLVWMETETLADVSRKLVLPAMTVSDERDNDATPKLGKLRRYCSKTSRRTESCGQIKGRVKPAGKGKKARRRPVHPRSATPLWRRRLHYSHSIDRLRTPSLSLSQKRNPRRRRLRPPPPRLPRRLRPLQHRSLHIDLHQVSPCAQIRLLDLPLWRSFSQCLTLFRAPPSRPAFSLKVLRRSQSPWTRTPSPNLR